MVCAEVCGLCYNQEPHHNLGSGLQLVAMLESGAMLPLEPYRSEWPVLPPRTMVSSSPRLLLRVMSGSVAL